MRKPGGATYTNPLHLVPLAAARKRILWSVEAGDLVAIDAAIKGGFPILRRIAKNAAEHRVEHRVRDADALPR